MTRRFLLGLAVAAALLLGACAPAARFADDQRLPPEQAWQKVEDWVLDRWPEFNRAALRQLQETDLGIGDLFARTGLQFFVSDGLSALFVVQGDWVERIDHTGLLDAALEDVDGDGREEAVLLLDAGSGRSITTLCAVGGGAVLHRVVENASCPPGYALKKVDGRLHVVRGGGSAAQEDLGPVRVEGGRLLPAAGE